MREIDYSGQFERDYAREKKSSRNRDLDEKLSTVLDLLSTDKLLPIRYKDHPLRGEYSGTRECHIKPDLLLIYFKDKETKLVLVRLGSHSELFD